MGGSGEPEDGNNENSRVGSLSELEHSILNMLMQGSSLAEITRQTGYSEHFVAIMLEQVRKKTGASSQQHALALLLKAGVLKL